MRNVRLFAAEALQVSKGGGAPQVCRRHWTSTELLRFFQAALLTRNTEVLAEVIATLMAAARPAISRRGLGAGAEPDTTSMQLSCPAGSTMRKLFLAVDVALMFEHQRTHTQGSTLYLWADATDAGKREWLLTKATVVASGVCFASLLDAANLLCSKTRQASSSGSDSEALDEAALTDRRPSPCDPVPCERPKLDPARPRAEALQLLRSSLQDRTFPPSALGLRQASAAQKCAAVLHSLRLEVPSGDLEDMLCQVVSFTSDLGTEMFLPGVKLASLTELMPPWIQQDLEELRPDGCAGLPCKDTVHSGPRQRPRTRRLQRSQSRPAVERGRGSLGAHC